MKPITRTRAALLLAASLAAPALAADHQPINLRVTDELIVPGYQRLVAVTADFEAATAAGCADRARLEHAFHAVGDAWHDVELWRFGPVEYLDRRGRFWFWPDKHARMDRQLRQFLNAADRAVLTADAIRELSAALEGMPAAERLLFTEQADGLGGADAYACAYLHAIARNLNEIAAGIVHDWTDPQGQRALVVAIADGSSALYESADEYATELLKSLHTELLAIRDQKLALPLDASLEQARPHRAEFWRSGRALRNIGHNLESVRALFELLAAGIEDKALSDAIRGDFDAAANALAAITVPLYQAVTDPQQRPRVEAARAAVNTLAERIGKELPAALGLALGFNSLDGD